MIRIAIALLLISCALVPAQSVRRRPILAGASEPLLANLAASWKLSDLTDASGNGNTLTNNNTATFNTGHIGNAVYTAYLSSQYLSIASNAFVQAGDVDFTIGFWVYATSVGTGTSAVLSKTGVTAGQDEYIVYWTGGSDSKLHFGVYTATDSFHAVTTTGTMATTTWTCIVVWHNAAADTINISINDGTADSAGTTGALQAASNAAFMIGRNGETGTELYWDGRIDNVNIAKRVWTAGERTRFYNAGVGCEWNFSSCP